tara:strand:+ start:2201 stop:6148 length:3948 start_codon:yes stop_codon:yes gene_type:complete
MNKDLDDRLIPNGEYRDAINISVGNSEEDDIGALETILGNKPMSDTNLGITDLEVIGSYTDKSNSRIYAFVTDYNDTSDLSLGNNPVPASVTANCKIYYFTEPNDVTFLVSGSFLNFSKSSPITGISLIENLLFFTDNRNQPRKINVTKAATYYTEESQLSVAKYNPYEPIGLLKKVEATAGTGSTTTVIVLDEANTLIKKGMTLISTSSANVAKILATEYLYVIDVTGTNVTLQAAANSAPISTDKLYFLSTTMTGQEISPFFNGQQMPLTTTTTDNLDVAGVAEITLATANPDIHIGMTVSGGTSTGAAKVTLISANGLTLTLDIIQTIAINSTLTYSSSNSWPGDPDYLESRYVRFSYRFQYDDGEYSIMAPFSQIAFIPKQKGYFLDGNEDEAFRSTILKWMENGIQNIELLIPLPDQQENLGVQTTSAYKITSINVLYKEADSRAVKVLDRVPLNIAQQTSVGNVYTYDYLSAKPFRTLPENQTARVFDKVPVIAHSQETAGNRIMYGNFKDKYTPPISFNYRVGIGPKADTYKYDNWVEYPNHSVKQNRNYQVGFVLCDKYGRQSSVILSSATETTETINNVVFGGSTVYSPYNNSTESAANPVRNWFGDALKVLFDSPGINQQEIYETGKPGLYANITGNGDGFDVAGNTAIVNNSDPYFYNFTPIAGTPSANIPSDGGINYLRGEYKDFVEIIQRTLFNGQYSLTCDGPINKEIYESNGASTQVKYGYTINPKGWYSYKTVVKQNEQEYYNVYLPGIVKGYPYQDPSLTNIVKFPTDATNTSNIVLFNDNINKVPRDLAEVGPDQKQFRSSVQLFGRVENIMSAAAVVADPGVPANHQFFPVTNTSSVPLTDTAISISSATDSNMAFEVFPTFDSNEPTLYSTLTLTGQNSLFQLDTNPLIARLSTSQDIGASSLASANTANPSMVPFLAIYETEPVESLLDIYWETTTVGLIADLNAEINSTFNGISNFGSYVWNQAEALTLASPNVLTANVQPINSNNLTVTDTILRNFVSSNSNITYVNNSASTGGYNFKITDEFVFLHNSHSETFTLTMNVETTAASTAGGVAVAAGLLSPQLTIVGSLTNTQPSFTIAGSITKPDTFTGTLVTYAGLNGSSDSAANTQQLKWSITDVQPACTGCFSIGETSGILTKELTTTSPGTYVIDVKLEDTFNGSIVATPGVESITKEQTVVVTSTVVGTPFQISNVGLYNESCGGVGNPPVWNQNPLVNTYYHTGNGTGPKAGDTVYSDSGGTTLAATGYYTINALPADPPYNDSFQNNREYITINKFGAGSGVVDGSVPTDQPLFC